MTARYVIYVAFFLVHDKTNITMGICYRNVDAFVNKLGKFTLNGSGGILNTKNVNIYSRQGRCS